MKAEQLKHNIATGQLTARQHTAAVAEKHGLMDGIRNIAKKFGKPDVVQVIHDNGEVIAQYRRKDDGGK